MIIVINEKTIERRQDIFSNVFKMITVNIPKLINIPTTLINSNVTINAPENNTCFLIFSLSITFEFSWFYITFTK